MLNATPLNVIICGAAATVAAGYTLPEFGVDVEPLAWYINGWMYFVFLHISMFLANMVTSSALVKKEEDVQELMVPPLEEGVLTAIHDTIALRFAIVSAFIVGESPVRWGLRSCRCSGNRSGEEMKRPTRGTHGI